MNWFAVFIHFRGFKRDRFVADGPDWITHKAVHGLRFLERADLIDALLFFGQELNELFD